MQASYSGCLIFLGGYQALHEKRYRELWMRFLRHVRRVIPYLFRVHAISFGGLSVASG
jgi:hypothetical protein